MDNQYFGTITHPNFLDWDDGKQNDYLVDLKLFSIVHSVTTIPEKDLKIPGKLGISFSSPNKSLKHSFDLKLQKSIYDWLLIKYGFYLENYLDTFMARLKNSYFGLDKDEEKKIALSEFNNIYNILIQSSLKNNQDKFKALYNRRGFLKDYVSNERDIVLAYLTGQEDYFDVPLYESNLYIKNIIAFEGNIKILLDLNKTYEFGEDAYFSDFQILIARYETIVNPSYDLTIFKFIEDFMNSITKFKLANTVSLFFFLKENKLIQETADEFKSQINKLFNLELGKLKLPESSTNKHNIRMQNLSIKWAEFHK